MSFDFEIRIWTRTKVDCFNAFKQCLSILADIVFLKNVLVSVCHPQPVSWKYFRVD